LRAAQQTGRPFHTVNLIDDIRPRLLPTGQQKAHKFETLIDVLRDDGVIKIQDDSLIRAATTVPVGDPRDGFAWAIKGKRHRMGGKITRIGKTGSPRCCRRQPFHGTVIRLVALLDAGAGSYGLCQTGGSV